MLNIIKYRNIWLGISSFFVVMSVIFILLWGLKFGIDFTGGSLLEVEFNDTRPEKAVIDQEFSELDLNSLVTQPIGEKGMIIRFQESGEEEHQAVIAALNRAAGNKADVQIDTTGTSTGAIEINDIKLSVLTELRFDSVGPSVGQELKSRSVTAIFIVLILIVAFIAWTFRKVSRPVESWKYGVSATIALFHDVLITIGVFAFLGRFYGVEVNTAFVAAVLTVLGYSVNDTIVVFDRIRENLPKSDDDFETTVNTSINQTIGRSINTSATVLLALAAIYFYGGDSIHSFALALMIGVFFGTYSSIFIASPILVIWEKFRKK